MTTDELYNSIVKSHCDEISGLLSNVSTAELDVLLDKLYCYWFDVRKNLDEQMCVNNIFYSNFYVYMANEAEAKAKFLYVKAIRMMKEKK